LSSNRAAEIMLKKAEQKFELAKYSLSRGLLDACVSELYYSAFQTVTALILSRNEQVSNKHTFVRSWLNKNLGQTGKVSLEMVKTYNRLMDLRSDADYGVEIQFQQSDIETLLTHVDGFNHSIRKLIEDEKTF
jgi:uncharacterized protein (UPF0332 family)